MSVRAFARAFAYLFVRLFCLLACLFAHVGMFVYIFVRSYARVLVCSCGRLCDGSSLCVHGVSVYSKMWLHAHACDWLFVVFVLFACVFVHCCVCL